MKYNPAFIEPMLCLSTVHLIKRTCDTFADGQIEGWPIFHKNEYGAFVHCNSGGISKVPQDLRRVMEFARGYSIQWIKFDPDGCEIDELPIYRASWEISEGDTP